MPYDGRPATQRTVGPLFVGVSLKMYLGHAETLSWCESVRDLALARPDLHHRLELVVLPSFPALAPAHECFTGVAVGLGAQDLFWEDSGAFTGEVGGPYLRELDCRYVEIGHAERRRIFHEDDEVLAMKVQAAVRNRIVPVVCVGEHEATSADSALRTCIAQLDGMLADVRATRDPTEVVVAYEPAWVIGAAHPAPFELIRAVCTGLRSWLDTADGLAGRVIYGGSAGPGLLAEIAGSVDGLFLGRFAHDLTALADIVDEGARLTSARRSPTSAGSGVEARS